MRLSEIVCPFIPETQGVFNLITSKTASAGLYKFYSYISYIDLWFLETNPIAKDVTHYVSRF